MSINETLITNSLSIKTDIYNGVPISQIAKKLAVTSTDLDLFLRKYRKYFLLKGNKLESLPELHNLLLRLKLIKLINKVLPSIRKLIKERTNCAKSIIDLTPKLMVKAYVSNNYDKISKYRRSGMTYVEITRLLGCEYTAKQLKDQMWRHQNLNEGQLEIVLESESSGRFIPLTAFVKLEVQAVVHGDGNGAVLNAILNQLIALNRLLIGIRDTINFVISQKD